jgi:hypothetical protein
LFRKSIDDCIDGGITCIRFQSLFYQLPHLLDILSVLEHLHALILQVDCLTVEEAVLSDENEVEDDTRGRDEKFNKVEVVESAILLFFA